MYKSVFAVALFAIVAVLGCGGGQSEPEAVVEETVAVDEAPAQEAVAEVRHDALYVCNCGPDCDCGTVSVGPGTCDCGKELVGGHVLMIDGNVATVCTCGADCTCELDPEDPTKCGCGEPVKQVSLEGKGLYYCNCGSSCKCNFISNEPGTCECGMELTTS